MRCVMAVTAYLFTSVIDPLSTKLQSVHETLVLPVTSTYRSQECLRIIADAVLEDRLDRLDLSNLLRWVASYEHQIGILAHLDRTDPVGQPQIRRTVECADANRIDRRETCS